jgi:signal transduction histidine kinase
VKSQASSLNSLGRMYVEWGKFETGIEYYKKSLQLLDSVTDREIVGIRYNNIGVTYQLMGKHREAIDWIGRAMKIDQEENNKLKIGIRNFNLGNSYLALRDFSNARKNLESAALFFEKAKMPSRLSKVYSSLGQLSTETNQFQKAEKYLLDAQKLAEAGGTLPEMDNVYQKLYHFYKKQGDVANTLKYFELRTQTKDSIYSLNASKQIEELEAQYQNEKKEAEIVKLEAENELRQKELKFRKRERNLAIAGLLVFAGLLAGLYFLFNTVKKQKSVLATQNNELDRLNQTQNRLFGIVSHDMRNVAAAYQASAKVIQYHLGKGQPEKLIPIADDIGKNARNLSAMLENLLQWAVIQLKGIEPVKQQIGLKGEFQMQAQLFAEESARKSNKIEIISNDESVWCDPESLRLILRNLISNALKFTQNGIVKLESNRELNETIIKISDTGCGMPPEIVKNLFALGKEKVRQGTSGERGTGLGMHMVAEHIAKNNGTVTVESIENKGTMFTIKLPSEQL